MSFLKMTKVVPLSLLQILLLVTPTPGQLRVEGSEFILGSEPFNIWGVNIKSGMNLSREQVRASADRLAFLGVNYVRLHTLSETYYGDSDGPMGIVSRVGTSRRLEKLDAFWALVNSLRDRGMYYGINVVKGRYYLPGDVDILTTTEEDRQAWRKAVTGMPRTAAAKRAMEYTTSFDERSHALVKEYARKFLNLKNPKTGQPIKEDPFFVMIETINEGTGQRIIRARNGAKALPKYFRDKLIRKWNEYLIAKYGDDTALRAAWKEAEKIGLAEDESLANRNVNLQPICAELAKYSQARAADFKDFLVRQDMAFVRDMLKMYREEGFRGPVTFGDINLVASGNGQEYWESSGLCDFYTEHGYISGIDIFRSKNTKVLKMRVKGKKHPFDVGRPYWRSEMRITDDSLSRLLHPLYSAVYFSLTGLDGITFFVWDLDYTFPYITSPYTIEKFNSAYDLIADIPWQFVFRAAGRLYRSQQIVPLSDAASLTRLSKNENITTKQVYRRNNEGMLRVETDRFIAVATDRPYSGTHNGVKFDLRSDKCNIVILEKISEDQYEVTAVGPAGTDPSQWNTDTTSVHGSLTFPGREIMEIQHIDVVGNVKRKLEAHGSKLDFSDDAQLYRIQFKTP